MKGKTNKKKLYIILGATLGAAMIAGVAVTVVKCGCSPQKYEVIAEKNDLQVNYNFDSSGEEGSDYTLIHVKKDGKDINNAVFTVDGDNGKYVRIDGNQVTIIDPGYASQDEEVVSQTTEITITAKINNKVIGSVNITLHPDRESGISGSDNISLIWGESYAETYTFDLYGQDSDLIGKEQVWSVDGSLPSGVEFTTNGNLQIVGTVDIATYNFNIVCTIDSTAFLKSIVLIINVHPATVLGQNTLNINSVSGESDAYVINDKFNQPVNEASWSLTNAPAGVSFDNGSKKIVWIANIVPGIYDTLVLSAIKANYTITSINITLNVNALNASITGNEEIELEWIGNTDYSPAVYNYSFIWNATMISNATWSCSGLTSGISFVKVDNDTQGLIFNGLTPIGDYDITITATKDYYNLFTKHVSISIVEAIATISGAEVLTGGAYGTTNSSSYSFVRNDNAEVVENVNWSVVDTTSSHPIPYIQINDNGNLQWYSNLVEGTYYLTIIAQNSQYVTATKDITLVRSIANVEIVAENGSAQTGANGIYGVGGTSQGYYVYSANAGKISDVNYTLTSVSLGTKINIDINDDEINFTWDASVNAGTYSDITITATKDHYLISSLIVTLQIDAKVGASIVGDSAISASPLFSVDKQYNLQILGWSIIAGNTWSLIGSSIPTGVTIDQSGKLTCNQVIQGSYSFDIRVVNSNYTSIADFSVNLTSNNETTSIIGDSSFELTYGDVGSSTSYSLLGGQTATWSCNTSSIPGITFDETSKNFKWTTGNQLVAGTYTASIEAAISGYTILPFAVTIIVNEAEMAIKANGISDSINATIEQNIEGVGGTINGCAQWQISGGSIAANTITFGVTGFDSPVPKWTMNVLATTGFAITNLSITTGGLLSWDAGTFSGATATIEIIANLTNYTTATYMLSLYFPSIPVNAYVESAPAVIATTFDINGSVNQSGTEKFSIIGDDGSFSWAIIGGTQDGVGMTTNGNLFWLKENPTVSPIVLTARATTSNSEGKYASQNIDVTINLTISDLTNISTIVTDTSITLPLNPNEETAIRDVAYFWMLEQYNGMSEAAAKAQAIADHVLDSNGWFDETLYDVSLNYASKTITLTVKTTNQYYSHTSPNDVIVITWVIA